MLADLLSESYDADLEGSLEDVRRRRHQQRGAAGGVQSGRRRRDRGNGSRRRGGSAGTRKVRATGFDGRLRRVSGAPMTRYRGRSKAGR